MIMSGEREARFSVATKKPSQFAPNPAITSILLLYKEHSLCCAVCGAQSTSRGTWSSRIEAGDDGLTSSTHQLLSTSGESRQEDQSFARDLVYPPRSASSNCLFSGPKSRTLIYLTPSQKRDLQLPHIMTDPNPATAPAPPAADAAAAASTPAASASSNLVVHHLDDSRSQRILWLLEELQVPYTIKQYKRVERRAPKELQAVHPLGKSPLITDNGKTIAESGAIVDYLIRKYGNGRLVPTGEDDKQEDVFCG